jgi:hypothetical protein
VNIGIETRFSSHDLTLPSFKGCFSAFAIFGVGRNCAHSCTK